MAQYCVKLKTIAEEQRLQLIYTPMNYAEIQVTVSDLSRPGLALAGYYDYFDPLRIQIFGKLEASYLSSLDADTRRERIDAFVSRQPVAVVLSATADILPELLEAAERYQICLLRTAYSTSESIARLNYAMYRYLAPRTTIHGVVVEVYGEGMLITGDSGIGKSETALELIKRGHRLVADDAVEIRCVAKNQLIAAAPEMIRYYMEVRGIGGVDVRRLYGIGAVKPSGSIDLVVNLRRWEDGADYDRMGLDTEFTEILDVKIPSITLPVAPGRNLAVILELAAMNNRQKNSGFNAAHDLMARHDAAIDAGGF